MHKIMENLQITECQTSDLDGILEIFNEAVLNSTAIYLDDPLDRSWIENWHKQKLAHGFPVLCIRDRNGCVMGFSSYGTFREKIGYRYTVEHSVYVNKDFRGRGLGNILLEAIIEHARQKGFHTMIGVIDADNEISIRLHEKYGFVLTGILKESGFKFNRWLNVAFMQLILNH